MSYPSDPADFEKLDDDLLEDYLRSFCSNITDIDIEGMKPLRNAIEEVLDRWKRHQDFNSAFKDI